MKIPTQDLCERLSHVEGMRRIGPLIAEARATIEAQAARIAELEEKLGAWAGQAIEDHARIAALEAKCALLSQSLEQEEKRSAALEAGLTDGVTDDMAVLQSRVEELEAQVRERGERVAALETYLQAWEKVEPMSWFYFEDGEFIRMYDSEEKAEAAREKFGGDVTPVYERPPVDAQIAHPPAAAASDVMTYPEELTPDLREVLGWTCFQCGPIAHAMRAAGMDINPKAEDEQAHALHWMVKLVLKHGAEWRAAGAEDIRGWKAAITVQKEQGK
jgi:predicted RNase H-like nuclease (RuvC/YqgF family)